jgi:hypothetical protein
MENSIIKSRKGILFEVILELTALTKTMRGLE